MEKRFDLETVNYVSETVINRREKARLLELGLALEDSLAVVFSAKESLFKALYPTVKEYFDFSVAEVIEIDETNRQIHLIIQHELSGSVKKGTNFIVEFNISNDYVLTLLAQ